MAFPGPYGPQGKIGLGRKGGKAHAEPCATRALARREERDLAGLGQTLQIGAQLRLVSLGADERTALLLQGLLEQRCHLARAIPNRDDARLGTAVLGLADRRPSVILSVHEGCLVLSTEGRGLENAQRQALRAERQARAQPQCFRAPCLAAKAQGVL